MRRLIDTVQIFVLRVLYSRSSLLHCTFTKLCLMKNIILSNARSVLLKAVKVSRRIQIAIESIFRREMNYSSSDM